MGGSGAPSSPRLYGELAAWWPLLSDPADYVEEAGFYQRQLLAACDGPLRTLVELIPDRFEYRTGVTYVGSTVEDLLEAEAGVCQDFAHLSLLLLRRHGIAARYVSGYLWAAPEDGGADSVEVETHAWLEALLPGGGGRGEPVWVGADPTNRRMAGESHVKIGHGRAYADVPPIKGVYRGAGTTELNVQVKMHRLNGA